VGGNLQLFQGIHSQYLVNLASQHGTHTRHCLEQFFRIKFTPQPVHADKSSMASQFLQASGNTLPNEWQLGQAGNASLRKQVANVLLAGLHRFCSTAVGSNPERIRILLFQ
jgi:hypothetical protein